MKRLLLGIIILAIGIYLYQMYYNYKPVEVEGKLTVIQASNIDIHSASLTPQPEFAFIQGSIKNTSENPLSDILIIYTVGYDSLLAYVNFLPPGVTTQFKTDRCRVQGKNIQFSLAKVKYHKERD